MKPLQLPFQDQRLLEAAEGWLGLGDWREANKELERIEAKFRVHPSVLELRYKIYAMAERWEMALEVASSLLKKSAEFDGIAWTYTVYNT